MPVRSIRGLRRDAAAALTAVWFVVAVTATPAGAHGVDVEAELDDGPAQLELTDETGEVCLRFDSVVGPSDRITIASVSSGEVVLELGEGFGVENVCQFLDADAVDAVLADVDDHELVLRQPSGTVTRAVLAKPLPPISETTLPGSDADEGGPNLPLVFAIGAGAGIAIAVVRKRFRSSK